MSRESREVIVTAVSPTISDEETKKRCTEVVEGLFTFHEKYHGKDKKEETA